MGQDKTVLKLDWKPMRILAATIAIVTLPHLPTHAQASRDIELQVGVVQRFGDNPKETLTLQAGEGDRLQLQFAGGDGSPQQLQAEKVTLKIDTPPLDEPILDERVVLSNHRSFESAEHMAARWRSLGIETEIAQPDRWQVWAHPDVYDSPTVRRWLLESLHANGYTQAYLDTQMRDRATQAYWVVDGYRYNRDELAVSSSNRIVRVIEGDPQNPDAVFVYGGNLRLQPNTYGDYTLVNLVPLETYLRGVVPHEIGPNAPYEAAKAQAIIARTYALRNLRRFAVDNYQLCADTDCQVYFGLEHTSNAADRAISATAGQVLTYDNELVDALYSSTSGGITSPFEDAWEGPPRPYLIAVVDSVSNAWNLEANPLDDEANFRRFMSLETGFNEEEWDMFRWRGTTSLEEMTEFMKRYFRRNDRPINFSEIKEVRITNRSRSGRVMEMEVQTDSGIITIPGDEVRNAFYPPISTLFYIDPVYKEKEPEDEDTNTTENRDREPEKYLWGYTFVGGGFGHGVGLSQTGASRLAELGWSSDRILQFYYPGTQVQPLNEAIVFWRDPYR